MQEHSGKQAKTSNKYSVQRQNFGYRSVGMVPIPVYALLTGCYIHTAECDYNITVQ